MEVSFVYSVELKIWNFLYRLLVFDFSFWFKGTLALVEQYSIFPIVNPISWHIFKTPNVYRIFDFALNLAQIFENVHFDNRYCWNWKSVFPKSITGIAIYTFLERNSKKVTRPLEIIFLVVFWMQEICHSRNGCTNLAFIKLVAELMPVGLRYRSFFIYLSIYLYESSYLINLYKYACMYVSKCI